MLLPPFLKPLFEKSGHGIPLTRIRTLPRTRLYARPAVSMVISIRRLGRRRRHPRGCSSCRDGGYVGGPRRDRHDAADGTELFVGRIAFAAEGPAFAVPPDDGDPPDFAALAAEYADVLAGPPPDLPPDRGPAFELRINTGEHPMPRSRPMKRWSQGELDECRKQVASLLDQDWIVPSSASHAASVVFARKADGTWRSCQDYRGLNAITQRSVEPLPHVGQPRGASFFTKLDLAMAYMQFRIREEDQYKTSFRVPGGQPPLPDLRRLRTRLRSRPARLEPADAGALRPDLLR